MTLLEEQVLQAAKEIITQQSDRDKQVKIGPSDMADPCQHCLGSKLAGVKPRREFSMFPWLGTAMHKLIEWTADAARFIQRPGENDWAWYFFGEGRARFEMRIRVCYIEGYGWVEGNIDVFVEHGKLIIDWKSTSKKTIRKYQLHGLPQNYVGQLTMYQHGLRGAGYDVETGVLVFIPRDAATPDDLWAKEVPYDQATAVAIISRIEQIMVWVTAGRWHELPSDPDCFTCHPRFFA